MVYASCPGMNIVISKLNKLNETIDAVASR